MAKHIQQGIPSKFQQTFDKMNELFNCLGNYKSYREHMISQPPPLTPYLGVFLRDLTFLEVGNPDFIDEDRTQVNFDKYRMISSVLLELKNNQQISYYFPVQSDLQFIFKNVLPAFDDEQLFALSRVLEPPKSRSVADQSSFINRLRKTIT